MACKRLLQFCVVVILVMAVEVTFAEQPFSTVQQQWPPLESSWQPRLLPPVTEVSPSQSASHPLYLEPYVTRSEYERLRREFEQLGSQLNQLQYASKARVSEISPTARRVNHLQPMWECGDIPGWEIARSQDWMGLGRLQRMRTLIAESCDMDLYMRLDSVGRLQYLQQNNVVDSIGPSSVIPGPLEPGIQTPFGQFSFLADVGGGSIEVFFDIFIATRPHPDQLQGNEGYLLVRDLSGPLQRMFEFVQIKAGEFEMDFGDAHYRRSNNADVQRNPLIGNYVVDPRATEIGAEIFNPPDSLPINWLLGVGVGNTGDFQNDRGWQVHAKLFSEAIGRLRPSVSFFWSDHSGNPTGFPGTGSKSDLFRSNRSGGPYSEVLGAGNAPGQVLPGNGQQVTAIQFDLTAMVDPLELYGHCGLVEDSDTNGDAAGTPTESWVYFAAEGIYRFTPRCYAAGRYSGAAAQHLVSAADGTRDVNSNGLVHRFQIGGGYWLHDLILAKLEYVHQFYDGFTPDGSQASGVDVWTDPAFDGVLAEISFAF